MTEGKESDFEQTAGIRFRDANLLREALTHRSYLNEHPDWPLPHNERLEYLGDAVLELVVSESLYKWYPRFSEGQLTVLRAALVNWEQLGRVAEEAGLQNYVLLSRGERAGAAKAREVILANAFEAVIGALYLDRGLEASREFILRFVMKHADEILATKSYRDPKSALQEMTQEERKLTPAYRLLEERGPAHDRIFRMGVYFGEEFIAEGSGSSKQEAELEAARAALKKLARDA